MALKFRSKIKFLVVYGYEVHPESPDGVGAFRSDRKPVLQARTYAERRQSAADFRRLRNIRRQVLVDEFGARSASWRLLGKREYAHPVVVIDVTGKTAFIRDWAEAAEVDDFLDGMLAGKAP